jgi:hypothetical protein
MALQKQNLLYALRMETVMHTTGPRIFQQTEK